MRLLWILAPTLAVGCGGAGGPEPGGAPPARVEAAPFLGMADDRARTVGDENPDSALAGVETVTRVQEATYADYLERKKGGRVSAEQRRGRSVYFAVPQVRPVPFPNGSSASLEVVERYKAPIPDGE